MKKVVRILTYIINLPLYFISCLIPKDKNLWLFGAWFGERYSDSPKYLFEHLNKHHPEIRSVWLSKNKFTIDLVTNRGYEAYYIYSFKGYLLSARAILSVICVGMTDLNMYIPTKYVINTWHGIPLKKINYDDSVNRGVLTESKSSLLRVFFPFFRKESEYSLLIASSEVEANNLTTAFRAKDGVVSISGLPRNDALFEKNRSSSQKKVVYMPTHRKEGKLDVVQFIINDLTYIDDRLDNLGIELYLKLHYYHEKSIVNKSYKNIHLIKDKDIDQDIYSIMNTFDILITDYSSVFFDFLLLDRPIIFAPFDLGDYLSTDRGMYFDYNAVTPGPKCVNWGEILDWVVNFIDNPNLFADERHKVRDLFHLYKDGRSSERVFEAILILLNRATHG